VVRLTNVRPPPVPVAANVATEEAEERLFAEEGPAGGCASGECLPEPAPAPTMAPRPAPAAPVAAGPDNTLRRPMQEQWRAAVEAVREASGRHAKSLAFGRLVALKDGEVTVAYPPSQGFHKVTVTGNGRALIEKALTEHFGRPTRLVVQEATEGEGSAAQGLTSLAEQDAQERTEHERSTEGRVRSHPAVRATLKLLGGEIEHIQVYEQPVRPAATPASEAPEDSP
jgi:hypothetical protein